jgi:hypothetical protein
MTQTKKSDAFKIGSSVGATCLGEYAPFLSIDLLPREKASIGSKKWKLLPSKILMGLDSDDEEQSTAPPRSNINPSTHGPTLNPMRILNTTRQLYPKSATSYPKDTMP